MPVHDVAASGFDAQADAYERARPSYPPDAVAWLATHLRIGLGARVVDVAAGTGKLTRLLAPRGATLLAVEPVAAMARHLREAVPAVPLVSSAAEALPFAAHTLDAVTVAQAFHWFEPDIAFAELHRILRPGGRVGLLWNAPDRSIGWVDEIWGVMDRVEKRAPWREHEQWRESALGTRPGFGPLHEAAFRHEHRLSPADAVERVESVSHVAVLPPTEQAQVLDEVRALLAIHPQTRGRDILAMTYRVDGYWCEAES